MPARGGAAFKRVFSLPSTAQAPRPTAEAPPFAYATSFPANENPISENGRWFNTDPFQTFIQTETISGQRVAHGTQVGGPNAPFDDSFALLSGCGPSHRIRGVIWKGSGIPATNHEAELWASASTNNVQRSTAFGNSTTRGYECNVHHLGDYLQLGHFKGTNLYDQPLGVTPADLDLFELLCLYSASSTRLICWWNGVQKFDITDNTPEPIGVAGFGAFIHSGGDNTLFGFRSITITPP